MTEISSKNLSKFSREVQKRPQMHLLAVIPAVTQISSKTSRLFIVNFAKEFKLKIRTTREIESTKYGLTSNAISTFFSQHFSLFFFCFSYWSRVKFQYFSIFFLFFSGLPYWSEVTYRFGSVTHDPEEKWFTECRHLYYYQKQASYPQ